MKMNVPTLSGLLALALLAGSCGKKTVEPAAATTGSFAIEMEQLVGSDPLVLGAQVATANGQAFKVSEFKFVVSNLTLRRADGTTYLIPDGYYVIDAGKATSSHFIIDNVPLGDYIGLSFAVGLDAAHNTTTFESGDLTHASDLYSTTLGYSFMLLNGTSLLGTPGQPISYSTGGTSCLRTVSPTFGTSILPLKDGHIPEVHMSVNVQGLFAGTVPANTVNFSTTYQVRNGDAWAPLLADNYAAGMFVLEHIHPN